MLLFAMSGLGSLGLCLIALLLLMARQLPHNEPIKCGEHRLARKRSQ
jgi:hypothetical protein